MNIVAFLFQGVVHTVGGYMIFTAATFKYVFDHHSEDTYWCTADIGWITGHSYLTYGPLANGATSVLVRSVIMTWMGGRARAWLEAFMDLSLGMLPTLSLSEF